jgi:WD40 repeat protein
MRGRASVIVLPTAACALAAGCLGGVYSDPVGQATGGGGNGGTGSLLSGEWKECKRLGVGGPWRVAISADGGTLAVLFLDGQIALHRRSDGVLLRVIEASVTRPTASEHPDASLPRSSPAVALSGDGSIVAIADSRHVAGWRVADGGPVFDVPGGYEHVRLSPTGDRFLAWPRPVEPTFRFELRSAQDGGLLHADQVSAVTFSATGNELVSWRDGAVAVLQADATHASLREIPLSAPLTQATLSPEGSYLAGWVDSHVRLYRASDGTLLADEGMIVGPMEFSPDGSKLLMFPNSAISLFDFLSSSSKLRDIDPVRDAAVGPGGAPFIVADRSGVYLADDLLAPFSSLPTIPGQGFPIKALAVSPDGQWLAVGSDRRYKFSASATAPIRLHSEDVMLWNLPETRLARTFTGIAASSLQFSRDGQRLLMASHKPDPIGGWPQGHVQEWPLDGGAPIWALAIGQGLGGARYSPSGDRIAVDFADGVGLMATGDSTVAPTIAREITYPASAFSPDGKWLVTSGLSLWRLTDLTRAWTTALAPQPPVVPDRSDNWLAFSPDGKMIVASDVQFAWDGWTWTVETGTTLHRSSDGDLIYDFVGWFGRRPVFSPDGAWILAADLVWEIATGRTVTLHPDPRPTSVSTFLADGRIALAREDGVVEMFCPQ